VLRLGLGAISGLMVSRLLMPRGRGELAVLLYFPTLMGAFFSLGTPQAITALISKNTGNQEEALTAGFHLALAQVVLAIPLFMLCAPFTLTGDNRHLAFQVQISCACGAFIILVPYFNAMAYGLKRFNWVNAITLAGQTGYIVALLILWLIGALTPLSAALAALGSQLLQCLLHLVHIMPRWLFGHVAWGAYRKCLGLAVRFAAPSLAAVVLLNADRAVLIRTTTLDQIGYYAIAFAVTMPITTMTEAFTQIGFVEVSSAESAEVSFAVMLRRFQMAQVIALASFLGACILIDPVIRFGFGQAYIHAIPAAYPLALAMSLRAMTRTFENNLRGLKMIVPGTLGAAINLAVLVLLSIVLVPRWGALGFCCASLASEAFYLVSLVLYLRWQEKIQLRSLWGIRPCIVRAMTSALFELLREKFLAVNEEEVAESRC
jgi:O-antigen/teichoic acid export membrane protein